MRSQARSPFQKAISPNAPLRDIELQAFKDRLEKLKQKDFPLAKKFDEVEKFLDTPEKKKLNLCKLLYCTNYKQEMFLHLGTIIESVLNKVVDLYLTNRWQSPKNFKDEQSQSIVIDQFKKIKTLSDKGSLLVNYNYFNDIDTCELINHKIQAMRILRNYGGHSKGVNEFINSILTSDMGDGEVEDVFKIVLMVENAKTILLNNPPPSI